MSCIQERPTSFIRVSIYKGMPKRESCSVVLLLVRGVKLHSEQDHILGTMMTERQEKNGSIKVMSLTTKRGIKLLY